ncbi:MAG TPA: ATP-binding protein [Gemmatimonadota bacterium]
MRDASSTRSRTIPDAAGRILAVAAAEAAVTALLLVARGELDKVHVALAYLLLVLGATAAAGWTVGIVAAFLSFACFNFFFLAPYLTFVVADPLDWGVLLAFLFTSVVAARLLQRSRDAAAAAERHARDVERLAAVGAESLAAARAEDALAGLASTIRATLGLSDCAILPAGEPDDATETLSRYVADSGSAALELPDGASRLLPDDDPAVLASGALTVLLPLRVRGRVVGILRLASHEGLRLDRPRQDFTRALAQYAALAVERVRLERESRGADLLRETNRLKDALLAAVSHDLRTPLTTIKAQAELLRREGEPRAAVIEEEADRLNRSVSDLLELSRIESGSLPVHAELVAAEDLTGAALQRISGIAAGRRVQASLPPGEVIAVGRFDFAHALHALVNLLENALKYSPPESPVELSVARAGEFLAFTVRDCGPGVPEADVARIFEPFHRGTAALGSGAGAQPGSVLPGAGLGLSIARRLAEAQGGTVEVRPRDGGGSEFTLLLPAADLDAALLDGDPAVAHDAAPGPGEPTEPSPLPTGAAPASPSAEAAARPAQPSR